MAALVTWRTLYVLCSCFAPRERCCSLARLMRPRAWDAPTSGVRRTLDERLYWRARGYDHYGQQGSCAPYIGALIISVPANVFSFSSLHETLPVFAFAPLHVCAFAPLHLCAFAPLLLSSQCCSGLSTALVAHLLLSLFCSSLCCGLLALCSAFDSALHSPLLLVSVLHLSACFSASLIAWPSTKAMLKFFNQNC